MIGSLSLQNEFNANGFYDSLVNQNIFYSYLVSANGQFSEAQPINRLPSDQKHSK